jgi:hypothetical protein
MHGIKQRLFNRPADNPPPTPMFTVAEVERAMANVEDTERRKGAALIERLLAERDEAVRTAYLHGFDTATELTAGRPAVPTLVPVA